MKKTFDEVFRKDSFGFYQPRFNFLVKKDYFTDNMKWREGVSLSGIDFCLFKDCDFQFETNGSFKELVGFWHD